MYSFELKLSTKNTVTKGILFVNFMISKPVNEENAVLRVYTSKFVRTQKIRQGISKPIRYFTGPFDHKSS